MVKTVFAFTRRWQLLSRRRRELPAKACCSWIRRCSSWRDELEVDVDGGVGKGVPKPIAEAYWRAKNGVSRRLKEMSRNGQRK